MEYLFIRFDWLWKYWWTYVDFSSISKFEHIWMVSFNKQTGQIKNDSIGKIMSSSNENQNFLNKLMVWKF